VHLKSLKTIWFCFLAKVKRLAVLCSFFEHQHSTAERQLRNSQGCIGMKRGLYRDPQRLGQ